MLNDTTQPCGAVSVPFLGRLELQPTHRSQRVFHSMGGLGLTPAVRSRVAAHWSSWADCNKMVRDRHPIVADLIMRGIDHHPALCFDAVIWWKLDWRSHLAERCQSPRTSRTERPEVWLATPREHVFGRTAFRIPLGRGVATCQSNVEVTEGPVSLCGSHCVAHQQNHPDRTPTIPHLVVSPSSPAPFLSPPATADVATDLTSLAIIEQLAPGWGCWGGEAFRWSARPPKGACREAGGRVSTNVFVNAVGQSTGGGDRRRFTSVAWCTTGHRHHPRVPTARRRFTRRKSCRPQRFSFAGGQTEEGEDLH